MTRKVFVYRYAHEASGGISAYAYTIAYLTQQTRGACVHEVEAEDGRRAKQVAIKEHRDKCYEPMRLCRFIG